MRVDHFDPLGPALRWKGVLEPGDVEGPRPETTVECADGAFETQKPLGIPCCSAVPAFLDVAVEEDLEERLLAVEESRDGFQARLDVCVLGQQIAEG